VHCSRPAPRPLNGGVFFTVGREVDEGFFDEERHLQPWPLFPITGEKLLQCHPEHALCLLGTRTGALGGGGGLALHSENGGLAIPTGAPYGRENGLAARESTKLIFLPTCLGWYLQREKNDWQDKFDYMTPQNKENVCPDGSLVFT